ncbi:NADP-binding protein [Dacryopinax primogenitus]|uniref:NADP-binding protein n=1 Tax=Dacryopinax primogenitus (strain DJM 731) TaxID=1858805 RepID=M5GDF1_DACPD|nr:NADP-binding protein [Dacryopinax primogenitus]EJU04482.1 NADP-binding protein [Dacryopinax primogenitus]
MAGQARVILTGAGGGIGLAICTILLEEFGAKVVAIDINVSDALKALKEKHPESLQIVHGDITKPETSLEALKLEPSPTALMLNAGVCELVPIASSTPAHWSKVFNVNVLALLNTLIPAVPALRENKGRVVFTSSSAATKRRGAWASYNASKAAENAIARTFATEEPDITSIAVCPGMADTGMVERIRGKMGASAMKPDDHQFFVDAKKNMINPKDCGYVLANLAINGAHELSGEFFTWDSPQGAPYKRSE